MKEEPKRLFIRLSLAEAHRLVRQLIERGISKICLLGVDFDGTLTAKTDFPLITPLRPHTIETQRAFQATSGKVILKTCREGPELAAALECLEAAGFVPDAVNEQLAAFAAEAELRKVYVDLDIDDRDLGCPLDWDVIRRVLDMLGPQGLNPHLLPHADLLRELSDSSKAFFEEQYGIDYPRVHNFTGYARGPKGSGVRCSICSRLLAHGVHVIAHGSALMGKSGLVHAGCYGRLMGRS